MTECGCGRPTRDGAYVCDDCGDRLARALGDLAWLEEQLAITIGKQRGAPTEGGPAGAEKALPFNVAAGEVRDNLRNTLVGWIRVCAEERVRSSDPKDGLPEDNLKAMGRWLLWRVDGLAFHEAGYEAVDEIVYAVARAQQAIDRAPERQYVGPCACGRDLYRRPGAVMVKCKACEAEYDAEALTDTLRIKVPDLLVTAVEAAGLLSKYGLETPARIIHGWADRGKVVAHGTRKVTVNNRERDMNLFRFDDLVQLAADRSSRLSA
jgi:hypothetical protein